jgi:hypothetical protein
VSSLAAKTTGAVAYAAIEVILDGVGGTTAVSPPFMQPANIPTKATRVEGFVTDSSCSVEIFALDYDRCTGAQIARLLAKDIRSDGANPVGRFRWDASKANLNDNQLLPAYKNLQVRLAGCAAAFVPASPVLVGGGGAQIIASQYQAPVSGMLTL